MTEPTLSHIRSLMNNPRKLVHPLSRVAASLLPPPAGASPPGAAAVAAFVTLGKRPADMKPRVGASQNWWSTNKKASLVLNKCSWPCDLWLWRSQGWNPSNNDAINWCCRTPRLHLKVENCKQNRAATSRLPFRSTHNWFQVTLKKVVESKELRGSPGDTYSIC